MKRQRRAAQRPRSRAWSETEDAIVRAAVMKYGLHHWRRVAALVPPRTADECRARWSEWLDPSLARRDVWSAEEDGRLMELAQSLPSQWSSVALFLEGRTATACAERYEQLMLGERIPVAEADQTTTMADEAAARQQVLWEQARDKLVRGADERQRKTLARAMQAESGPDAKRRREGVSPAALSLDAVPFMDVLVSALLSESTGEESERGRLAEAEAPASGDASSIDRAWLRRRLEALPPPQFSFEETAPPPTLPPGEECETELCLPRPTCALDLELAEQFASAVDDPEAPEGPGAGSFAQAQALIRDELLAMFPMDAQRRITSVPLIVPDARAQRLVEDECRHERLHLWREAVGALAREPICGEHEVSDTQY